MPIDYAAEYNNRARIANGDEILARMARGSAGYRARVLTRRPADLNLRYGATTRQIIDLFRADGAVTHRSPSLSMAGSGAHSIRPTSAR
jgi:hypothetical protein